MGWTYRLIRIDGRSVEDVKRIIDFVNTDEFWKTNILSASKLREHFTQLFLKCKQTSMVKDVDDTDNWRGSDIRLWFQWMI